MISDARCACRACRLNKCKVAGMDRTAVQIRTERAKSSPSLTGTKSTVTTPATAETDESQNGSSSVKSDLSPAAGFGSPQSAFTTLTSVSTSAASASIFDSKQHSHHRWSSASGGEATLIPTPITVLGSVIMLSSVGF